APVATAHSWRRTASPGHGANRPEFQCCQTPACLRWAAGCPNPRDVPPAERPGPTGNGTFRDHVKDSCELQVVPQSRVEGRGQVQCPGIVGDQLEVGHREADLLHTEPSTSAYPVLGKRVGGSKQQCE